MASVDRATLRERGIAATRQLAKRQFTWLRATEATMLDASTASIGLDATRSYGGDSRHKWGELTAAFGPGRALDARMLLCNNYRFTPRSASNES